MCRGVVNFPLREPQARRTATSRLITAGQRKSAKLSLVDLVIVPGHNHAARHIPTDGDRAIPAGGDCAPPSLGLLQQAGKFLRQGLVFGEEFLQLQAQGGEGVFVVRMFGRVLDGFQRGGSGFHFGAQFVPQGFGVVEALFAGLLARVFWPLPVRPV
jgi:hypothetical protein